ncbi:nose resistant to fluoxetine protein 6-like [Belonocnema kinseyi]|uniref:nose resistant to fluoxetine protein 6-like n=1 Tax=Belonocnema kinseyi TaxID=2817044 RepID=UPI00143E05FA|nr:nose resistant to fluoxetine protein 6-like [Belonocnema kinseyi]
MEDIFGRLGPRSLLTTFKKTEKLYEYTEETCWGQFLAYANSLGKGETWALKMLDSSSKIPSGILTGNIIDLGMFDECISVQMVKGNIKIRGRHCMYSITLANQNSSVPLQPTLSICVPSACNANDVETFLNKTIHDIQLVKDLEIAEVTATCSSVGPQEWSHGSITSVTLFSILVIFLIICTFLDILQRSKHLQSAVASNLAEFSVYKSANKIFNMNVDSSSLTALYGIRALSMCWIVLGHEFVLGAMNVNINTVDIVDCMIHLWYLAVDMQLFLISPLILYPLIKKPKLGLLIWNVMFVSQIVAPAAIIATNKYVFMLEVSETIEDTVSMFKNLYSLAYTRGGSWLVGVLFGYLIYTQRSSLSKKTIYIGWVSCLLSFTFCTLGTNVMQQKDYVYNVVWESVFGAISRQLWAASVAWIILVCVSGHGGPINKFLSLPIFIPISRVSYCVYLVHIVIQGMKTFSTRTPHYFNDFHVFNHFLDTFTVSIVIAFFCSLLFEAPILTLEKMIFRRQKVKKGESKEALNETNEEK